MKNSLILAGLLAFGSVSVANELDAPQAPVAQLPDQTIVVRVNTVTGAVEKAELAGTLSETDAQAVAASANLEFAAVPAQNIRGELDREAGASSWYWWCPTYYSYGYNYYTPYYNTGFYNYGYYYSGYYSYSYYNYNYYYYRPYGYYGWWR